MIPTETINNPAKQHGFLNRMKTKWKLDSIFQVSMVLLTFTLTGSTVVYLRKWLFVWLEYNDHTPFWIKAVTYLVFIFPSYQVLILIYGTLFGQFKFFWEKEKKLFGFIQRKILRA